MGKPFGDGGYLINTDPFGTKRAKKEQEEAQQRAEETARQEKIEARAEQQRLEEKYGLTPGELDREERTFALEKERQGELTRRAGLSGEELLREGGPTTRSLIDRIYGRVGKTGRELFLEEGGPAAEQYAGRIEAPGVQDTFAPELELTRQMINAEANRRGVFGGLPEGGIRFEQLGRAGVDLAIKSARESLAQKSALTQAYVNMAQNARAEAGTVGERALTSAEKARAELDQFLSGQQNLSSSARGRAANVGIGAANIADAGTARSYGTITDIYGQQVGRARAEEDRNLAMLKDITKIALAPATGGASLALPTSSPTQTPWLPPKPGRYQKLRIRGEDEDFLKSPGW